jgi:hypothetical protein
MAISQGVKAQLRLARQTAKGTLASPAGGQIMRREQATFELVKEIYDTKSEITSTQQLLNIRHGVRTVNGKVSAIMSPGTYSDPLAAVLRRDFTAITPLAGQSITVAGTGPYTLTRAAGSYLTDGIKVGQVVRLTAGTFNAANLNKNLIVTDVQALVVTVSMVNALGTALVAEGPIAAATLTIPGKVTFTPPSGQTNIYYTAEVWYPDVPSSERHLDCKVSSVDLKLPGSGNAKIDLNMVGLDQSTGTSAYFTTPAIESTSGTLVAASGLVVYNGVAVATITDVNLKIDGMEAVANGVVGSVVRPDVFRGKVMITGSMTAYFDSAALSDQFRNETLSSIVLVMATGSGAASDFISLTIPVMKLNSATPMDGETGLTRSFNLMAIYNAAGGTGFATEQTTCYIQDSLAP